MTFESLLTLYDSPRIVAYMTNPSCPFIGGGHVVLLLAWRRWNGLEQSRGEKSSEKGRRKLSVSECAWYF